MRPEAGVGVDVGQRAVALFVYVARSEKRGWLVGDQITDEVARSAVAIQDVGVGSRAALRRL